MSSNKIERTQLHNVTGLKDRYEPAVITAAITGDVMPSMSKHIASSPDKIIAEAVAAARAGAAIVHIHGREKDGRPSARPEILAEIATGIREQCDVVLNFTTGGSVTMTDDERIGTLAAARPEIGSLNIATMNAEMFPDLDQSRRPTVDTQWERDYIEAASDTIFKNKLSSIRRYAAAFKEVGVTPEVEAFDIGHIYTAKMLLDEGTLEGPIRLQLVLGVFGGIGRSVEDLVMMVQTAQRLLGPQLGTLAVAAVGYPMQLRAAAIGLSWGLDCRVGLEDSLRLTRDRLATSNAELVEATVRIADAVGRPIATSSDVRASLGPWAGTPTTTESSPALTASA